ncbi:MAG: ArsR/SmtB family transcription factor [Lachnospirales bacterium]
MNFKDLNELFIHDLADFYKIYGDPSRLKILFELFDKEMNVSEISEQLNLTQSLVSHQLRILRQNDLVKYRKDGKNVYYSLDDLHIHNLIKEGVEHLKHKRGGHYE